MYFKFESNDSIKLFLDIYEITNNSSQVLKIKIKNRNFKLIPYEICSIILGIFLYIFLILGVILIFYANSMKKILSQISDKRIEVTKLLDIHKEKMKELYKEILVTKRYSKDNEINNNYIWDSCSKCNNKFED